MSEAASVTSVIVEADGGSRGNPGPAAYGAVLKDGGTGAVIAEDGTAIGRATNNVAEYRGLIAGLALAAEYAPDAAIEVRMDSKLVVEQMSGRWKIKHPDMKPLAAEADRLAPSGTVYVWVPRAQNVHADRLANEALDGVRSGITVAGADTPPEPDSAVETVEAPSRGWDGVMAPPTTLLLLRHGATPATAAKRFSGGVRGADPRLSDDGRDQVRLASEWLQPAAERIDAVVSSPVRRARESAEIVTEMLGRSGPVEDDAFAEADFGRWEGLTFGEVAEQFPDEMAAWRGSLDIGPPGGESFAQVERRVIDGLERLLHEHAGRTVLLVSHVTPIKLLVGRALGDPTSTLFTTELTPASLSVISFYPDPDGPPRGSLRLFNALPPGRDSF